MKFILCPKCKALLPDPDIDWIDSGYQNAAREHEEWHLNLEAELDYIKMGYNK